MLKKLVTSMVLGALALSAAWAYNEAPMLAAKVAAGDLPPVDERLPAEPVVVPPLAEVGQYGGNLSVGIPSAWGWFGDPQSTVGPETLMRIDTDYSGVVPNIVRSWEWEPDGKTVVMHFVQDAKWSDGAPFSADSVMFWYDHIVGNETLTPQPHSRWTPGGELMKLTQVDDYTIRYEFAAPYPLIEMQYAHYSGGPSSYSPGHYLEQFHADFQDADKLADMTKAAGFDEWHQLFNNKNRVCSVIACGEQPTMQPYVRIASNPQSHTLERNPYYWKVDPAGNQLPYIDQIQVSSVENTELLTAKMLAGEADWHGEGSDLSNYSVYQEGAQAGNYRVLLWDQDGSTDAAYFPNLTPKDPVIASINQDKRFRIALSLAINRDSINKTLFFGRGVIGQPTALPGAPWFDESFRDAYIEQDVAEANRLLDEMGMEWDANNEWRLRPDGNPLEYLVINGPIGLVNKVTELVLEDWKAIGIKVNFKVQDWGITHPLHQSGESHMFALLVDKSDAFGLTSGGNGLSWYAFTDGARYFDTPLLPPANSGSEWPPEFSPDEYPFNEIVRLQEVAGELQQTFDEDRRTELLKDIFRSQAENLWIIGTVVGKKPILVSNRLRNHPEVGVWGDGLKQMTAFHPEQMYLMQ